MIFFISLCRSTPVPHDFVPVHKFTVPVLKDSGVSGLVVQKPLMSTEHTQLLAGKPGMFVCVQMFVQDVFVCVCVCAGLQICVM